MRVGFAAVSQVGRRRWPGRLVAGLGDVESDVSGLGDKRDGVWTGRRREALSLAEALVIQALCWLGSPGAGVESNLSWTTGLLSNELSGSTRTPRALATQTMERWVSLNSSIDSIVDR